MSGVEQEDLSADSLQTFVIIWWEDAQFTILSSRLIYQIFVLLP